MRVSKGSSVLALMAAVAAGGCTAGSIGDTSSLPSAGAGPGADNGGAVPGGNAMGGGGSSGGGNPGAGAGTTPTLAPEMKAESDYQSPVATGNIVWTANPNSGRVAYVDATSFSVQTAQAGDGPTYLAAVPNPAKAAAEAAIVLNVRSHDATRLSRDPQGTLTPTTYGTTADANTWAMSPSGRWAIAWTDATRVANADATQGFQDVAVLDLWASGGSDAGSQVLAVGYRPSQIVFSVANATDPSGRAYETRAFAVTNDGISVIDLSGPVPAATNNFALSVPVAPDASAPDASAPDASAPDASAPDASAPDASAPDASAPDASAPDAAGADASVPDAAATEASTLDAQAPEASTVDAQAPDAVTSPATSPPPEATSGTPDVSFTPDGAYALVRRSGVAGITVVSLHDGSATSVPLPSVPTDLAVAPDGTFAVVVLRDIASVAVLPLPGVATGSASAAVTTIDGEIVGRAIVAEDLTTKATRVLLFTTAAPIDRLTVLTLLPKPSYRTIALHAPVLAVFPTADAKHAIVLHNVTPTQGSNVNGAFSIVPIDQDLPPKIVSLAAPPIAVALAPSSDRALVMVSDKTATFGVELAMMPSLEVMAYTLASPPTAVGIAAAAARGFVSQNYSDGRITFIDLAGGGARTITGFELGARVVQGSTP